MALVEARVERKVIPHEPGEWFEFRRLAIVERRSLKLLSIYGLTTPPPETATAEEREDWEGRRFDLALRWVKATVVAWSYPTPFAPDACDRLDERTLVWACLTAYLLSEGLETPEEKKADSPSSTGISPESPAPAAPTNGS